MILEIALMRHGKVDYPPIKIVSASDYSKWVEQYNQNGLDLSCPPHESLGQELKRYQYFVTSELPRSHFSAQHMGVPVSYCDAIFNEAEIPLPQGRYPLFSVRIWTILLRLAWYAGLQRNCESLRQAEMRAKRAAHLLVDLAEKHQTILLFGHGLLNRIIAKHLLEQGWSGPRKANSQYWSLSRYRLMPK